MPAPERFDVAPRRRRAPAAGAATGEGRFQARREQILAAAVAPLNRNGLRGMTLADVAQRLGLAPSAVGYYFRRKEDLAAGCYLASMATLSELIEAASAEDRPLEAVIRRLFEFRRQVELGEAAEIAWFEDVRTLRNETVNAAYTELYRRVRRLFGPATDEEARVARNVRTHLYLSQLYWAVSWLPQYHPHDYGRMAERLIDVLRHGFAAPGRRAEALALDLEVRETDDPRLAFLRAATELINERGYLGASVQKISERLNVTKGAFYHRHDAKSDLVAQCFERTWRIVAEAQAAADAAADCALQNLCSVASFLVERQLSGELPLIRSAALAAAPAELRPDLVAGFSRTAHRFASVICDGIADGSIRPLEAHVASFAVNGAINAATELHFWAPGAAPELITRHYVRPIFEGLLPA